MDDLPLVVSQLRHSSMDDLPLVVSQLRHSSKHSFEKKIVDGKQLDNLEVEARINLPHELDVIGPRRLLEHFSANVKVTYYIETKMPSLKHRFITHRQRTFYTDSSFSQELYSEYINKSSLHKVDFFDKWCTVHISSEMVVNDRSGNNTNLLQTKYTRYQVEKDNLYTEIIEELPGLSNSTYRGEQPKYRVEIEVKDADVFSLPELLEEVCRVNEIMHKSPIDKLDWLTIKHILGLRFEKQRHATYMTLYNTVHTVDDISSLSREPVTSYFCIAEDKIQKPITLQKVTDFYTIMLNQNKSWYVTPKIDGIRTFLIIIGNRVFYVNLKHEILLHTQIMTNELQLQCTIIDGEIISTNNKPCFYCIDIVVLDGEYIGQYLRQDRTDNVNELFTKVIKYTHIMKKPHELVINMQTMQNLIETWKKQFTMDGLIFVNFEKDYMQTPFKWKFKTTVDLLYIPTDNINTIPSLETNDRFIISKDYHCSFPDSNEQSIWEFALEYFVAGSKPSLYPLRRRADKPRPNSKKIFDINTHALPGGLFSGTSGFLMRKYHNREKTKIISSQPPNINILDIGTGQGGDLTKWINAIAHTVYCIEPDEYAISQLAERCSKLPAKEKQKIQVLQKYLRDVDIDTDFTIGHNFHLFTAFFCANAWEDKDWDKLIEIINKRGRKLCKLYIIAITKPKADDNECFTLKFLPYTKLKYIITLHQSRIKDLEETVVQTEFINKIKNECNFDSVQATTLNSTEDIMTYNEQKLSSMYTLFLFKKV